MRQLQRHTHGAVLGACGVCSGYSCATKCRFHQCRADAHKRSTLMSSGEYPQHWTPVEQVYSAWLTEAAEVQQGPAAVIRAMQKYLWKKNLSAGLAKKWQIGGRVGSDYSQWRTGHSEAAVKRPYAPEKPQLREALIAVVEAVVPRPPARVRGVANEHGWITFAKLCDELDEQKNGARSARGKKHAEDAHAENRSRRSRDLTAIAPVPAAQLDPTVLGLGSWLFDGGVPPYVIRTPDTLLSDRLASASAGLFVVVGPPKSGKSRSVQEVLARTLGSEYVQWINPAPGVLPLLVDLRRRDKEDHPCTGVIVLDDAQLLGVNPTAGMTVQRLTELSSRCRVIVVLHTADLSDWKRQVKDRRADSELNKFGATVELVELLDSHRIDYPSILDDTEAAAAARALTSISAQPGLDLTRLAEALASVDHFKAMADATRTKAEIDWALIEAAIDATILSPAGIEIDGLAQLCKLHYRALQRNRPWRTSKFDEAFESATTGNAGSPHAILIRHTTKDNAYRLFDALVPHLRSPDRSLEHLRGFDLNGPASFQAGWWEHLAGRPIEARAWFNYSAAYENSDAMFNLGTLAAQDGDFEEARRWWQLAAAQNHPNSMHNLGILDQRRDDLANARAWYERAASHDHPDAMFNLGSLAHQDGDFEEARHWWEQAATHNHPGAMIKLGTQSHQEGDLRTAWYWFEMAANHDNTDAMFNLGVLAREADNLAEGTAWWKQAAVHGHIESIYNLGVLAREDPDLTEARRWFEKAAAKDHFGAMNDLGALAFHLGDLKEARRWWEQAATHNHPEAMNNLGVLAEKKNDYAEARYWFERAATHHSFGAMENLAALAEKENDYVEAHHWHKQAADHGQPAAMNKVGEFNRRNGDFEEARHWWEQAATYNHPGAMNNLGVLAEKKNDYAEARYWYERAATHDQPEAMKNLGSLAYQGGDFEEARRWWEQAAAHGHLDAIIDLGKLAFKEGNTVVAREWWRRAADLDHADAMHILGAFAYDDDDYATARQWWEKAAKLNHPGAMFSLGVLTYEDEDEELATARAWFKQAAALGHEDARRTLNELDSEDEDDE
ncbi:hypothetical protein D1O33_24430 (plasmid) [Rhodococcus rhodochrous]|nr:hypothetical protein D1O33_24430 [Rhodococcus rhodochrous]